MVKADLSRYDLSGFKPMPFEVEPKTRYVRPLLKTDVTHHR